jgi:hypothetical protein
MLEWTLYLIVGFIALFPSLWLAVKGKQYTNKLISKEHIEESSPKSWPGDIVATAVFFVYSVLMFIWMPT